MNQKATPFINFIIITMTEKKPYVSPEIRVVWLQQQVHLLQSSPTTQLNPLNPLLPGGDPLLVP